MRKVVCAARGPVKEGQFNEICKRILHAKQHFDCAKNHLISTKQDKPKLVCVHCPLPKPMGNVLSKKQLFISGIFFCKQAGFQKDS